MLQRDRLRRRSNRELDTATARQKIKLQRQRLRGQIPTHWANVGSEENPVSKEKQLQTQQLLSGQATAKAQPCRNMLGLWPTKKEKGTGRAQPSATARVLKPPGTNKNNGHI